MACTLPSVAASASAPLPPAVAAAILSHHFCDGAELALPWPQKPPQSSPSLPCASCWRVAGPIASLLAPAFLAENLRGLRALASGIMEDEPLALAVVSGRLLISCGHRSYEHLGLAGQRAAGKRPKGEAKRFCVSVDLRGAAGVAGTPAAARLAAALRLTGLSDVRLAWDDGRECPKLPAPLSATRCKAEASVEHLPRLPVPQLAAGSWCELAPMAAAGTDDASGGEPTPKRRRADSGQRGGETADEGGGARAPLVQLQDWLGLVACGARDALYAATEPPDAYLSMPSFPSLGLSAPTHEASAVHAHRWQGDALIPPPTLHGLLSEAADLVSRGCLPWAALTVWGANEAPVSWGHYEQPIADAEEHSHDLTVVALPPPQAGAPCRFVTFYSTDGAGAFRPRVTEHDAAAQAHAERAQDDDADDVGGDSDDFLSL